LRSDDGVFFTKAGARKLAHYVEREVTRLLAARSGPIAVPIEPATPDANVVPGQPAPRPLAGPVMPLVASSVGTDQLLGGPGSRPAAVDALAARTLVKGEALRRPPAAPTITRGRAGKSAASRPRAIRRWRPPRRADRWRQCPDRRQLLLPPASAAAGSRYSSRCRFGRRKPTPVAARFLRRLRHDAASARTAAWTRQPGCATPAG
jgi:hypothetical protein